MKTGPGSPERPLRVAIVGSGPAGFYAAEALFREKDLAVRVDVLDRLPTPYGLVRYGVAPDHQKMKSVIKVYEKTAANPAFRFFGNVRLGADVSVNDLRGLYDQIVYAMGAETDRRLGVPGEDLAGSHSATEFVGWYNGHPDHREGVYDLSVRGAAVFGVGNVAMDVARILARDPEELADSDITDYALAALRRSGVREVWVIGRRGAAQAAFSPKEIEELGTLEGVDLVVDPAQLPIDDATRREIEDDTNARKNLEYLEKKVAEGERGAPRKIRLLFCASPVRLIESAGRVSGVEVERNELVRDERGVRAKGTGERRVLPVGLVFRAIGYHGVAVPGVPFDERRGIVANLDGRVTEAAGGPARAGEYVVGWAKRGPSGLIGTNKGDSAATVALMSSDLPDGVTGAAPAEPSALPELLGRRGVRFVTFDDWKRLDRLEEERGRALGKIRERFLSIDEMLAALAEDSAARRG
ncbi:MAG: FAD-dependent oxidoreductase [bacterium]